MDTVGKRIAHIALTKRLLGVLVKDLGDGREHGREPNQVWLELLSGEVHDEFTEYFSNHTAVAPFFATGGITEWDKGGAEVRKFTALIIKMKSAEGKPLPAQLAFTKLRSFPKFEAIIEQRKLCMRHQDTLSAPPPTTEEFSNSAL